MQEDRQNNNKYNNKRNFDQRQNKVQYYNNDNKIRQQIKKSFQHVSEFAQEQLDDSQKNFVPPKYNNFVENKAASEYVEKLLKNLPNVLLSLSILALQRKQIIKTFVDAYTNAQSKIKNPTPMVEKILIVIQEYGRIIYNLGTFKKLNWMIGSLTLFLNDIPVIFQNIRLYGTNVQEKNQLLILDKIVSNIEKLKENVLPHDKNQNNQNQYYQKIQKDLDTLKEFMNTKKTPSSDSDTNKHQEKTMKNIISRVSKNMENSHKTFSSQNKKSSNKHKKKTKR